MGQTPKAVLEAARAAEDLHKQTYEAQPEDVKTEPKEPEPPKEPVQGELFTENGAPAKPEPPKADESAEYWKQRFQTLKGKYDAELPRTVGQLRQAESEIAQLRATVAQLDAQLRATPQGDKATKFGGVDNEPLASPEEREEYGQDFTAFIERIAKQAAQRTAEKSQTPAQPQAPVAAQQAQPPQAQPMYQVLDQKVPRWREINRDPEFIGWLQHPDPLSGSTRHHMLHQAFGSGDVNRVAAFFMSYLQSSGQPSRPADPPPAPATPGKVPLEQLAGPRQTAPSGQPQQPAAKRVWTGKDIDTFYRKCIQGVYRGKEAERARIEADIAEAMAEGRVDPGR